jgi:hypothetical protein
MPKLSDELSSRPKRSAVQATCCSFIHQQIFYESAALPFVIPTEANPDFLPRSTGQGSVCAFP